MIREIMTIMIIQRGCSDVTRAEDGKLHSHLEWPYAFRYILSYFHNENELTKLKPLISGSNFIFAYKLQYILTLKMADFILLTWLQLLTN